MDYSKFKIIDGKFWGVFLNIDQTLIGRFYFWYKGPEGDLFKVPPEALLEFQKLGKIMENALKSLFNPDKYNYLSLNNQTTHLHVHIIPRYSRKVNAFGLVFEDLSFGKPYMSNKDFFLPEELLLEIRDKIESEIKTSRE